MLILGTKSSAISTPDIRSNRPMSHLSMPNDSQVDVSGISKNILNKTPAEIASALYAKTAMYDFNMATMIATNQYSNKSTNNHNSMEPNVTEDQVINTHNEYNVNNNFSPETADNNVQKDIGTYDFQTVQKNQTQNDEFSKPFYDVDEQNLNKYNTKQANIYKANQKPFDGQSMHSDVCSDNEYYLEVGNSEFYFMRLKSLKNYRSRRTRLEERRVRKEMGLDEDDNSYCSSISSLNSNDPVIYATFPRRQSPTNFKEFNKLLNGSPGNQKVKILYYLLFYLFLINIFI